MITFRKGAANNFNQDNSIFTHRKLEMYFDWQEARNETCCIVACYAQASFAKFNFCEIFAIEKS